MSCCGRRIRFRLLATHTGNRLVIVLAGNQLLRRLYRDRFAWRALSMLGLSACSDALLPADYAGPSAIATGGTVVRGRDGAYVEAQNPRLNVLWWADVGSGADPLKLLTQPVAFQRSQQLKKDWDIGIAAPLVAARVRRNVGNSDPPLAIGQLIYFDDRDGNGKLDWTCTGSGCDEIKAISRQFVVYLDHDVLCNSASPSGGEGKAGLGAGFHYFAHNDGGFEESPLHGDLEFVLSEAAPRWSDYVAALSSLAHHLTRAYRVNALDGC